MNSFFIFCLLLTSSLAFKNDLSPKHLSKAMQFKLMQMIEILNKEKVDRYFYQKSKEPAFKNQSIINLKTKTKFLVSFFFRKT